jgi:hypothetical protein
MSRVPLREHLELKSAAERERTNLLMAITLAAAAFVWVEIQRRLGVLNHAHETAQDVAKTTVRQDIYDQGKEAQDKRINQIETAQSNALASRSATFAVVAAAVGVLGLIVLFANGTIG